MKRVLLISNNILSNIDNNGKTYASILSNYTPSYIAQLYFSENVYENPNLCSNYLNITDVDILKSLIKQNKFQKKLNNVKQDCSSFKANKWKKIAKKIISPFIRDMLWAMEQRHYPYLKEWVKGVNPDVIFLVSGPYDFPNKIAKRISAEFKIPIVLYYTDDYLINSIKRNIFYPFVKVHRYKNYKQIISASSKRYVIGEKMAQIYSEYFKTPFDYIMNSVDIIPFSPKMEFGNIIVISYFGSLHSKRWESIIKLSESMPKNWIINVYTMSLENSIKKELLKHSNIRLCGGVTGVNLINTMQDSDFLLHVESNDSYYRRLTKLSVSTKIPEYLMVSRPIIAFGPQEVASMQLLSTNRIGIPIDCTYSTHEIKKILENALLNVSQIHKMVERGYEYVVKNFNRQKNSQKVYSDIENL